MLSFLLKPSSVCCASGYYFMQYTGLVFFVCQLTSCIHVYNITFLDRYTVALALILYMFNPVGID